jgi:hypothetical protein
MTDRLTVDTITSDQLDALQLKAARMEHAVKQYAELRVRLEDAETGITAAIRQRKEQEDRALRAEAAVERVRTYLDGRDFAVTPDSILKLLDQTPPTNPPNSTREQLPDHILNTIRDRLPDYLSTACQTADIAACAVDQHPGMYDELRTHAERLHNRCRRNQKFTGQLCVCGCHPTEKEN